MRISDWSSDVCSSDLQPVVTAADGTLNGFEALIRWHNKKLGNVSPGRFIPLAEDARLISPIGEWVLRTACHEAMKWPSNLKVAINVSADQLTDPSFASVVVSALRSEEHTSELQSLLRSSYA